MVRVGRHRGAGVCGILRLMQGLFVFRIVREKRRDGLRACGAARPLRASRPEGVDLAAVRTATSGDPLPPRALALNTLLSGRLCPPW